MCVASHRAAHGVVAVISQKRHLALKAGLKLDSQQPHRLVICSFQQPVQGATLPIPSHDKRKPVRQHSGSSILLAADGPYSLSIPGRRSDAKAILKSCVVPLVFTPGRVTLDRPIRRQRLELSNEPPYHSRPVYSVHTIRPRALTGCERPRLRPAPFVPSRRPMSMERRQ